MNNIYFHLDKRLSFIKRALLIGVAFLLAFSFMPGIYAEESKSGGQLLLEYGFINGGDGGALMLDSLLTREQLAIIVCSLMGETEDAKAFEGKPKYTDAYRFPSWSVPFIAYCQEKGYMIGSDGSFRNTAEVSGAELASVILRALGYKSTKYSVGLSQLEKLGCSVPDKKALTRGEAFDAIWTAVSNPIMKDGKILGVVTGRISEEEAKFSVKEVRSDNLGFITVVFNRSVDPKSTSTNSIRLTKSGVSVFISSVSVRGNQVIFVPDTRLSETDYVIELDGIYSVWGESDIMDRYIDSIKVKDAGAPNLVAIEFPGERSVTLIFDEPVSRVGDVEFWLGNANISIEAANPTGLGTSRLTFSVNSTLIEGGEYTVRAQYFKDLAGNSSAINYVSGVFYKPKANPVMTIGSHTEEYIELIFSRAVQGLDPIRFYIGDKDRRPVRITATNNYYDRALTATEQVERAYLWFYVKGKSDQKDALPEDEFELVVDTENIFDGFSMPLEPGIFRVK